MKKISSVILFTILTAMLLSLFSCSQSAEVEDAPEYEASYDESDLNGYEMLYVHANTDFQGASKGAEIVLGYLLDTAFSDLALQRLKEVETNLNCKINLEYEAARTVTGNLTTYYMANIHYADACLDTSALQAEAMRAGFLCGLSDMLDVRNTAKWGSVGLNMAMFWDDDQYAVSPNYWPELVYNCISFPFCVNEDIVADVGATDPREYVENNTWTWDMFEECLHQFTYNTGSYQVYGFASHPVYFFQMMFRSNGDELIDYESATSNYETCGYYTSSAYDALDRGYKILYETCKDCVYPTTDRFVAAEKFVAGEVAIVCSNSELITGTESSYVYKMDNFGLIPCPLGPNAEPGQYKSCYESMNYSIAIPVNSTEPESTAKILDAIYEPLPGYETPESIIDYMGTQVFFAQSDADIFYTMSQNTEYCFFHEGARELIEILGGYNHDVVPVSQALQSFENKYKTVYEESLSHTYDGIRAVWGD